ELAEWKKATVQYNYHIYCDGMRPRQFTVGIQRTDSTNFALLIKLFELGMPFKGRQAFLASIIKV
ncbi:MAG: hypothetical protein ACI3XC_06810, partial [Phascolarctobacterium sp.]